MFSKYKIAVVTLALLLMGNIMMAQTDEALPLSYFQKNAEVVMFVTMIATLVVAIMVILALSSYLIDSVEDLRRQALIEKGMISAEEEEDVLSKLWRKFLNSLNDSVPITKEESIDMGHEYDGIRELDNNLPPWWKLLFYASIVWAAGYLFYFHFSDYGKLSAEEYKEEMAEAERKQEEYLEKVADMVDETSVVALVDGSALSNGKRLYNVNCIACHGAFGEGGVGPNLTDDYWIHGGGIKNVFKTIKYGVPAKGMIAWQQQLKPKQMQEISSYILTMHGTNPANAKGPQGELWVEEAGGEATLGDSVIIVVDTVSDAEAVVDTATIE